MFYITAQVPSVQERKQTVCRPASLIALFYGYQLLLPNSSNISFHNSTLVSLGDFFLSSTLNPYDLDSSLVLSSRVGK